VTLLVERVKVRKDRVPVDEALEREARRFGRELDEALQEVAGSARSDAVARSLQERSAADAVASIDLDPLRNALGGQQNRIAGEHLRQAISAPGPMTPVQAVLHFQMIEPEAIRYAALRSGTLIRDVQRQVRETVNGLVVDALQGDYTVATLADQIERVVPLTSRQAQTVQNSYDKTFKRLFDSGKTRAKAEAMAQKVADRVAKKSLSGRASGIARTELMSASNAGRFSGFAAGVGSGIDSVDSRKEWITGGNPCPLCDPMDGEVVLWDSNFSNGMLTPLVHPSCRCVVAYLPPERKVEKRLDRDGLYTFDPTIGQSIRLAQIAREYLLGRMTKTDHDDAWDRILNFRRPQ